MNAPTADDADAFGRYMQEWAARLGLSDWRVCRSARQAARGAMAEVKVDVDGRVASYRLGRSFGSEQVSAHTLEQTAAHECLHVLLAELLWLARDPDVPQDVVDSAEHRVINVLERLLVPESGAIAPKLRARGR